MRILGIINKYLYFAGTRKSFRIAFKKVVAFKPYSDGLGVQKDGITAKPMIFVTDDGWFTSNLVQNLANLPEEVQRKAVRKQKVELRGASTLA